MMIIHFGEVGLISLPGIVTAYSHSIALVKEGLFYLVQDKKSDSCGSSMELSALYIKINNKFHK